MYALPPAVPLGLYLDLIPTITEFRKKESEEPGKLITVLHNQYWIGTIRKRYKSKTNKSNSNSVRRSKYKIEHPRLNFTDRIGVEQNCVILSGRFCMLFST